MVLEGQQRRGGGKSIISSEDADRDLVRLPIAEHTCERREVNAVGSEIQRLHSWNRTPQQRIDSAGINPGIDRGNAGRCAIDGDLALTERAAAAALQFISYVVGHAC